MTDFLNGSFVQSLIEIFFQILIIITNIILFPFNAIIDQFFPQLGDLLGQISQLFDLATTYLGWAISLVGIPGVVISLIVGYYSFVVGSSLVVWGAKLAVKWIGHFS